MNVLEQLEARGAVFTDKHFVYASGKHGEGYINMDLLFPDTRLVHAICQELVAPFAGKFDVVAGPATGGIVLAVLAALAAEKPGVWADKANGGFVFERAGFAETIQGKRVLVVEDLLTTGGSVEKVCREVEACGGVVAGISSICNRGDVTAEQLHVPRLESLAHVNFTAMPANQCTLCSANVPIINNMGHGDDYQAEHPEYAGGYLSL